MTLKSYGVAILGGLLVVLTSCSTADQPSALDKPSSMTQEQGSVTVADSPTRVHKFRCKLLPGSLDPCFNFTGMVSTTIGSSLSASARAVAIQPNGGIVVVGTSLSRFTYDFTIVRYNPNGSLDNNFGAAGIQRTDFAFGNDQANAVAVQSDGKIVVAGSSSSDTDSNFALARYNPNGSLDTTFGGTGKIVTSLSLGADVATSMALQSDGKIVVAGYDFSPLQGNNFALARYNLDGSLDTTFGVGGKKQTTFTASSDDKANAVAIQSDGKIVLVGDTHEDVINADQDIALARYNTDGSLDTGFGSGGKRIADFFNHYEYSRAVVIQPDGKIVVAGGYFEGTKLGTVERFESDGRTDTGFGENGIGIQLVFGHGVAFTSALQPDGKIIVGGWASGPDTSDFGLARLNTNGSPDLAFGSSFGRLTTDFNGDDTAYALAIQRDGKIVAVGTGGGAQFSVARYNP
jgi:uncharacterized delta-60 repeat protein